jgi:hypothetical protein
MPEYYQPDVYALLAARQYNPQLLGYRRALEVGQGITDQLQSLGDDIVRHKMMRQQQAAAAAGYPLASGPGGGVRGAMQAVDFQSAMARQRQADMAAQLDAARAAQQVQAAQQVPAGPSSGGVGAGRGLDQDGALQDAFAYHTQQRILQQALGGASNPDDYNHITDGIRALYTAARTKGLKVDQPEIEPWAGPRAPAGVGSISPDAPAVDANDESAQPDAGAGAAPGAAIAATDRPPSQAALDVGAVPPGAIQALRADPTLSDQFDAKYGTGLGAFMLRR